MRTEQRRSGQEGMRMKAHPTARFLLGSSKRESMATDLGQDFECRQPVGWQISNIRLRTSVTGTSQSSLFRQATLAAGCAVLISYGL